jgi:glycosyltransferase involved in cell wall biosynthesis
VAGLATVSVIVPTFDRAALLPRALDSLLSQTRPADQIIVVDDGSTDGTPELLERYGPRLEVLRQTNAGVAAARNRGIRYAAGEWLAFLDSDDAWLPHKLERQLGSLTRSGKRIVHADEIWIRRGRRVNPMKKHAKAGGFIFERCLPLCLISPSAVIIHRDVFQAVGLFDETLPACEDYDLWLRICARYPVEFLPEPLIFKYGGHADQLSRRYWGMDRFRIRALEKLLASGGVGAENRPAALRVLIRKLEIYGDGARKRGRVEEARRCRRRRDEYREQLNALKIPVAAEGNR